MSPQYHHNCTMLDKNTLRLYAAGWVTKYTSMDMALFLLLSWLLCSSSMTRSWLAVPLPLFTGFPCAFLRNVGLCDSEAPPLGDSLPWLLDGLGLGTWVGLGLSGGLGWVVKAADCCDCCMWTGELWTWWMTTGEEGITSDLIVELWGSSGAEGELGWTNAGGASAGTSDGGLFSNEIWAEGSGPFWGPSVAHLQRIETVCDTNHVENTDQKKGTFLQH